MSGEQSEVKAVNPSSEHRRLQLSPTIKFGVQIAVVMGLITGVMMSMGILVSLAVEGAIFKSILVSVFSLAGLAVAVLLGALAVKDHSWKEVDKK